MFQSLLHLYAVGWIFMELVLWLWNGKLRNDMNREQLLLTKLAEECSEVAQITLKSQQFGLQEICPNQPYTNAQRMHHELNDLIAAIEMLNDECGLGFEQDRLCIAVKKAKVNKFADYSKSLGCVQ